MHHGEASSVIGSVCVDDPVTKTRERQHLRKARVAIDTSSARSPTSNGANDDADGSDQIRRTKSCTGPSHDRRHRHDDVITAVRRVTSDVTGKPITTRHDDVIRGTPATVSALEVSGIVSCMVCNFYTVCACKTLHVKHFLSVDINIRSLH